MKELFVYLRRGIGATVIQWFATTYLEIGEFI